MSSPLRYVHSWPSVVFACVAILGVVGIFALSGPDERITVLAIFSTLSTVGAAVARQAFAVPPPKAPKRIDSHGYDFRRCSECGREVAVEGHAEGCSKRDDDPGAGGEVLADGPPTRPTRIPERVSVKRPERQLRKLAKLWRMGLGMPAQRVARLCVACLALTLSACSPSALQTHATIALVASHTLEVTRVSALATCAARRDTCAADAACVERVRTDCLAVADAQDATVAAVAVYVDSIELAALADEGRVMEALRFALEAASRAWASLGERLAAVGIALPSLGGVR
jgi:hypothetical protein